MKRYNKITPEGTKDVLFRECVVRRRVEDELASFFAARSYREVMTPGIEFYDVFEGLETGILPENMYKTTDQHGRLVVLRPDSTVPIARLAGDPAAESAASHPAVLQSSGVPQQCAADGPQ